GRVRVNNTATVVNNSTIATAPALIGPIPTVSVNTLLTTQTHTANTKSGLLLALGFEQFVYEDWVSLGVEYDYVQYGRVNAGPTTLAGQTVINNPLGFAAF